MLIFQYQGFPHAVDTPESEIISSCAALVLTDASVGSIISEIPHDQRKATGYFDDDELKYLFKIEYSVVAEDETDEVEVTVSHNDSGSHYVAGRVNENICDE